MRPIIVPFATLLLSGCGGSKSPEPRAPVETATVKQESSAPKPSADPAPSSAPATHAEPVSAKLPTECASKDTVCNMPADFVKRLCQATYPNVALVLFSKGMPWTHGYLTRKTQAWNAEGGASKQDWLEFDEEVVILASRMPPKGGVQVSGTGGYQAYRWDGSCVTLASEEVTLRLPPEPKHPRIEWKYLDDGMREALRKDPKIDETVIEVKKECKGVSVGDVSKKCEIADKKLGARIVRYVTTVGGLPEPQKLP